MTRKELAARIALKHALNDRMASRSIRGYLKNLVINSAPDPRPFGQVADDWQWAVYEPIFEALEAVTGVRRLYRPGRGTMKGHPGKSQDLYKGPTGFWRELTRGSDKTSMIARLVNWALAYSRRSLSMAIASGDSDQAALITEAMKTEQDLNPWLANKIEMRKTFATGPGGMVKVLTSDAGTAWGGVYDVIICDEITHWKKPDLFPVLASGKEKRAGCVFVIITNAGTIGSWQHELKLKVSLDPQWDVYAAPGPLASWMSAENVEAIRRLLPRGLARRVLDNHWTDPAEEADFLTREEIQRCEDLGKDMGLRWVDTGAAGVRYVASIDYGPRRDRTALAVVHLDNVGHLILDRLDVWQGSPDNPIQISRVEEWIDRVNVAFYRPKLVVDPYQMESTIQRYEVNQQVERFEARGGKSNYEMAENMRSMISSRLMAWYPGAGSLIVDGRHEDLADEIMGLVLKPTPYGYRFDHTASFHDDRSVALGMAALTAVRMDPSGPGVGPVPLPNPTSVPVLLGQRRTAFQPVSQKVFGIYTGGRG